MWQSNPVSINASGGAQLIKEVTLKPFYVNSNLKDYNMNGWTLDHIFNIKGGRMGSTPPQSGPPIAIIIYIHNMSTYNCIQKSSKVQDVV